MAVQALERTPGECPVEELTGIRDAPERDCACDALLADDVEFIEEARTSGATARVAVEGHRSRLDDLVDAHHGARFEGSSQSRV